MPTVAPPQRKLLALDGGGIRGILTLEVLARMEDVLCRKLGAGSDFVLGDYFDYVAGTSTGANIAAGVATGMPVAAMQDLYREASGKAFVKLRRHRVLARFRYKYPAAGLAQVLQDQFGRDTTFGAPRKTLLLAVLHNSETDSPWPLSSNPAAKYNDPTREDDNSKTPLWQVIRASTAAPTFFPAEEVLLSPKPKHRKVFVDGGITPFNNPAFQLFLQATLPEYRLCWPTGVNRLLLVSVGTGMTPQEHRGPGTEEDEPRLQRQVGAEVADVRGPQPAGHAVPSVRRLPLRRRARLGGRELRGDRQHRPGPQAVHLSAVQRHAQRARPHHARPGRPRLAASQPHGLGRAEPSGRPARVGAAVARRVQLDHFDGFDQAASGDLRPACGGAG